MSEKKVRVFNTQQGKSEVFTVSSDAGWTEIKSKIASFNTNDKTLMVGEKELKDIEVPDEQEFTIFAYPIESKGGV